VLDGAGVLLPLKPVTRSYSGPAASEQQDVRNCARLAATT